jgi:signal transduction histidine kinase
MPAQGRLVDISLTISPLWDESGHVIGASGIARDITSRRQAEEAFRLFLAATFHDVRNALQLIVGIAGLPPDEQPSSMTEQTRSKLFALVETVNEMMTDLVDHSREGKERIEVEEFSAVAFLQECVAGIESPCGEKGLRLAIELPEHGTLRTDRVKLRRILMNLLHNAVRYTPSGEIHVMAKLDATRLHLVIRDTGIGIPPDARARLFEPYYRHEQARELQPLGTGLGLSIVKRFCDLLGGTLVLGSGTGVGTTWELDLPRELTPREIQLG